MAKPLYVAKFDMNPEGDQSNRQRHHNAVRRNLAFALSLPSHHLHDYAKWYSDAHNTISKQSDDLGISPHRGAGIVAAVSPAMDFENQNIEVLNHIAGLSTEHWDAIRTDAKRQRDSYVEQRSRGIKHPSTPRSEEVKSMLSEVAPSLSSSTNRFILQAGELFHNENSSYDDVLQRVGRGGASNNLKRHSFAHNLEFVEQGTSPHVTIDYRMGDMAANAMRPTKHDRGLDAQGRYAHHEQWVRNVAAGFRREMPEFAHISDADMQAILWKGGKNLIEMHGFTKSGEPRKQGPTRTGQQYFDHRGRPFHEIY